MCKNEWFHVIWDSKTTREYVFLVEQLANDIKVYWTMYILIIILLCVDEFQIFVQPGGHAEQLNLSGLYILKVFNRFLQLYSASGAIPTDFHCSLANATVFCTATNIRESEAGMLMIQTSR